MSGQPTDQAEAAPKTENNEVKTEAEPKPIGRGVFGNIYDAFKGKAQKAFDFLLRKKSGDLLGVFHRKGVGDIDVVWGDKGGGFDHIVSKHVGEGKSFSTVDEAAQVIDDIIKTGAKDFEDGDKIVFKKGRKLVTIRKNVRDNGKKIADKNWVLTAYDELSADGDVSAIAPTNEVQAARHTGKSDAKVETTSEKTKNEKESVAQSENDNDVADFLEKTKAKHPGATVLMRRGSQYHIYGEEAKSVAEILGIKGREHPNPRLGYEVAFPFRAPCGYYRFARQWEKGTASDSEEHPGENRDEQHDHYDGAERPFGEEKGRRDS